MPVLYKFWINWNSFPFLTVTFYKESEESPSDPEAPTNADEADLSQPANQDDSQHQEVIVTPAEQGTEDDSVVEPLLRKNTSSTNLEKASGATPFHIDDGNTGQCKEMDKSDIEMTIFSADTHNSNSSKL